MQKSPFISVYRLLQLFFISILLVSLNSCQNENLLTNEDEDEITHTNVTAETHDTEDEACRLVPEFCKETNDTQLGIIGNDPKAGILVTIGDENFQVFPIELFKNSKELVVRKGEELFILSTNKNEYYTSNSSDYQLPSQLSNLFKLDFEKIINQKLSIEEIANSSGGTVKEVLGSRKSIDFTNSNPPPSTLSTITTEYCTIRFVANVQNYVNEFAYGGYITNTTNLTSAVEQAFENCPNLYPENFCNSCKDPVCIIDNLSENFNISDFEKTVIKANYLRLLVGLEDEEYNLFIAGEHSTLVEDLYSLFSEESACTNKEKIIEAFSDENCNLNTQTNEEYTICLLNRLGSAFSDVNNTKVRVENGEVIDVLSNILPYSCFSFNLQSTLPNNYNTTISYWKPTFTEISLIPWGFKIYDFKVSLDIRIVSIPGEEYCIVQNTTADAFNNSVESAVSFIGMDKIYRLNNADEEVEIALEFYLEQQLLIKFPLSPIDNVTSPAEDPSLGFPLISTIPGQADDCCG